MDRSEVKREVGDFLLKLRKLDNSHFNESMKFDVDMEDLDRRYDEHFKKLVDKFVDKLMELGE